MFTEEQLNSFDIEERTAALDDLIARADNLTPQNDNINMHLHSFFSYNAMGYSPSRLLWEARKVGLYAAGLCDFDVLDGLNEFLSAGIKLNIRTTVSLETRSFFSDYADKEINSPGEPGVFYIIGTGFTRTPRPESKESETLQSLRTGARKRNIELVDRINNHIPEIAINYEKDVVKLTPANNATERHIVSAYITKAQNVFNNPEKLIEFWSSLLNNTTMEMKNLIKDQRTMEATVRSKLIKKNGIGYRQPSTETFPPVEKFIQWILSCGAVPTAAWLDGTSDGEKKCESLFERFRSKGISAVCAMPDRSWNISEDRERKIKTEKLREMVETSNRMEIPINIGTEMNSPGQPFFDNLECPALKPYKESFLRGARIMTGHTLLAKYADYSYAGAKADSDFRSLKEKNNFFESIGSLPQLNIETTSHLSGLKPNEALDWFKSRL